MNVQEAIFTAEEVLTCETVSDQGVDPRWQSIISVAEFVKTNPDEVWNFVARWGGSKDEDLRDAIATCLLEHLLEYHFDMIFPRVEKAVDKIPLFGDTFSRCHKFGQSEQPRNPELFDRLLARSRLAR